MPINSNVGASERVSVDRGGAADVEIGFSGAGGQNVSIDRSGAGQQVEVDYGDGGGYGYDEADYQDYANQMAARDMGSMASQQQQAQQQMQVQQQPRQQEARPRPTDVARAAGMRTDESAGPAQRRMAAQADQAQRGPSVPVLDASDIGNLDVMSSRRTPLDANEIHENLAESGAQLAVARMRSNGPLTPDEDVVPSAMAMRAVDERHRDEGRRDGDRTNLERMFDRESLDSQVTVDEDRPDSIYNRPVGYDRRDRSPKLKQFSTKRPTSVMKSVKNRMATAFKRLGVGNRIYQKMLADPSLDFREVGVGVQELMAAVEQNPTTVDRLISRYVNDFQGAAGMSPSKLIELINDSDIYVGTFKPPNNRGQDVQRRRLRVMTGKRRGIYLHPMMAAMYTADFDGDDMEVSLDPNVAEYARDPMDYMIGVDGEHSLDTKFLPVSHIVEVGGESPREFIRTKMLSGFANIDGRTLRPLIDAIVRLSETASSEEDDQAKAWGDVFREARRVADAMNPGNKVGSDTMMSRLCQAVYNCMQDIRVQDALLTMGVDASMPEPRTYEDSAIYKIVDGMVEGVVPNNFQDLKEMLTGFMGNVEKKNAPFRFTADVGKMMKMDSRFQIGDEFVFDPNNREHMQAFFESTVKFAESRRMAKEVKKAGRSSYYTQVLRDKVIKEVGFPEAYKNYADFLDRFCRSYARHSAIINEANLVFLSNMGISSNSNRELVSPLNPSNGDVRLSDLAEPMLSIYGTYSVERMFGALSKFGVATAKADPRWKGTPGHVTKLSKYGPDASKVYEREYEYSRSEFWVTGKYLKHSLRKFKSENRLIRNSESAQRYTSTTLGSLSDMTDVDAQFRMLLAIADKRTGTASKFNEKVYGKEIKRRDGSRYFDYEGTTVKMLSDLLVEIDRLDTDGTVSGRRDQTLWINDVVSTLIESGPDMFYHFNMDSPAGFMKSKLARKMIEHSSSPEVLGGIRTAMVFDYRMERINDLHDNMPNPDDNLDQYVDAYNNLALAKDELSAASEVWRGIIREFEAEATQGQDSVFSILASGSKPEQVSVSGERYEWDGKHFYDATDFWKNPGEHTSLRSVIEDLDMDRDTKWKVIADVVRYWENDPYLKAWEVGYQLEIGNDSSYSLGSGGAQGALAVHNDFEQAFNRWGKTCQAKMQEEVDSAYGKFSQQSGSLIHTLERLDSSPWELIAIDDGMYADSILSVMDKVYAQTEKASQHPWTNAIYAAVSFQRNGGYMNDITRTDDRMLGIMSVDSVGIQEVVHLLADPEDELWVYNQYGEIGCLTRETLLQNALGRELGPDVERDIWEFLRQEPRVASAIRRHNACVIADTDGTGYVGSALSMEETICRSSGHANPIDHVKYLMRDHPVYAGIISLVNPAKGSVTRNARDRIRITERYLDEQIYAYASANADSKQSAIEILDDLGATEESLIEALRSNYDKFLEDLGLPTTQGDGGYDNGELRDDATTTYSTVVEYLTKYIDEVKSNVDLGQSVPELSSRPVWLGVDTSSMASFWDVVQELGGAKTAVSTGVEGAETYQFAQWASHVSAKDRYADLEIVSDDVDESWNGAWTNVRDADGNPLLVQVGEDGSISNYDQLMRGKESQNLDEVVVLVPETYQVQDRSTDSHGNPVASLFMYMVSKRSNGAEAFNLKAKKAGLDGKDSITKMQGKRRMVEGKPANFFEIQKELRDIAASRGVDAAKEHLAQMMLRENEELGYEDMTLSNYMSIADLMLVQGGDEEGGAAELHLRSLEMLFSAIKHRLGASVDEMTDDEIRRAANEIVGDTSETGVGIAEMNPLDALDGIQPKSKASSFNGIRQNSSVFERNYDLLSEIMESSEPLGVGGISQKLAKSLTERLADRKRGVAGIREVASRIDTVRNYSVVGYAASADGSESIRWTIGPSNAIIIGGGQISSDRVSEICNRAYELGMTVVVSPENRNKIPMDMVADAMPCSDMGDVLIPCFDMRLNGAEATPYNGRFAIFQAPFTRYVASVEDSINEFQLGDAQAKVTNDLIDRIKVVDNGSQQIKADDLFPNVFRNPAFRHSTFEVSFASGNEIAQRIANGVRCTIDYGIVEGGNGFDQRRHDVDAAVERYRQRWSEADPDGVMRGDGVECEPGDIVAWAECYIRDQLTGEEQCVFAPIIPFPLHGATKGVPETFRVEQVATADDDNTVFSVDWSNTSDVNNGFVKYFDSSGGANKGMVELIRDSIKERRLLRDGTPIDVYIAKQSTDSRKIGTDRRIKTMISLMALSRMHGYNFASSDGAFPSDPENHPENDDIRERMLHNRIPTSEWRGWLRNGDMLFTTDERLNAFLNYECRKVLMNGGNPYDYLSNVYTDTNGVEHNTHVMWEFEAMFDQGLNYEDGLLRFLHAMDPTLCPDGVDDQGEYLFRLARDGNALAQGYDTGVLQMLVPHQLSDGTTKYLWDNVYIGMSFFGEDYSGFSRPNINGASNFLDAMNTMSYYGVQLDEASARFRAMWATSDIGKVPRDGGAIGKA